MELLTRATACDWLTVCLRRHFPEPQLSMKAQSNMTSDHVCMEDAGGENQDVVRGQPGRDTLEVWRKS